MQFGRENLIHSLVDALVVVELDPEVLVDAALLHRVALLEVDVDHLKKDKRERRDVAMDVT